MGEVDLYFTSDRPVHVSIILRFHWNLTFTPIWTLWLWSHLIIPTKHKDSCGFFLVCPKGGWRLQMGFSPWLTWETKHTQSIAAVLLGHGCIFVLRWTMALNASEIQAAKPHFFWFGGESQEGFSSWKIGIFFPILFLCLGNISPIAKWYVLLLHLVSSLEENSSCEMLWGQLPTKSSKDPAFLV